MDFAGNVALAVGENISYVLVRTAAPEKASYIVAKALAPAVFNDRDLRMGEFDAGVWSAWNTSRSLMCTRCNQKNRIKFIRRIL